MLRDLPKQVQNGYEQRTPLGIGRPRDIADVAALLAREEGRWITNTKIHCEASVSASRAQSALYK